MSMSKSFLVSVCTSAAFALLLGACGDDDRAAKNENSRAPVIESSIVDEPSMTSVTPKTAIVEEVTLPAEPPAEAVAEPAEPEPATYDEAMERGRALRDGGDMAAALVMFEAALDKDPEGAQAHIEIARALCSLERGADAVLHAERGAELLPESSYAWNTVGRARLAAGDAEGAIDGFRKAAELNEDNSYAWNNLGYALMGMGRYEEAAAALEVATSGAEPTAYMWNNLGMAYEHLGELDLCRAAYRQSAELGSENAALNLERLEGVELIITEHEVMDAPFAAPEIEAVDSELPIVE